MLCCSHFGWKFSDFVHGNIDMSNATLSRRRRRLVSNSDCNAVHFLTDIIDIRDGVNSLQFSDDSSLSLHDLNDIVLHLATCWSDRSWLFWLLFLSSLLLFCTLLYDYYIK